MRWSRCVLISSLLTASLLLGCRGEERNRVVILVSGDTQGWITPCGCTANQSGGLARRASCVNRVARSADVLLLDVGGSATGTTPYQQMKLQSLLRGLKRMGLDAHNIGQSESRFSPDELQQIGSRAGVVWLSANLKTDKGMPFGKRVLHVKKGGLRIDVVGVIDPRLVEHSDWQASEPVRAVLDAFADSDADVRIVLAYFDEGGLRRLAESLPEVDYIIGGPTGQTMSPTRVGSVTILSSTNKGKFLASIALAPEGKRFRVVNQGIDEVHSDLEEDPQQLANLKDYYRQLSLSDFTADQSGLIERIGSSDEGYAIAGSASCSECHRQEDAVWRSSTHAHAWDVLKAKGAEFDPYCQQCHTTGYGLDGGFQSVAQSPTRVHVGCESCHGPSKAHVEDPSEPTPFPAAEQCVRCHDHENSPSFEYEGYWSKIYHENSSEDQ